MQNKPNFRKAKMNVISILTKDYENEQLCRRGENKPNQTQLQTQRLSKLFLALTFLSPSFNLAMQNWTIQKLESLLNLSINFADNTSCSLATPCLISGTG